MSTEPNTGAEMIAAERKRQIDTEGWTPEHDSAEHCHGELQHAARAYLERSPWLWPWNRSGFKPSRGADPYPDGRIRDLAKAGALIAAEIDRLVAAGGVL